MSVMLSDSGVTPAILTVIYLFLVWPVLLVACVVAAWVAYALRHVSAAWAALAFPAMWPIIPMAVWMIWIRAR
jgi:hypothetical protein